MPWDKFTRFLQFAGAALAVPASAAGVYSAYRSYFSNDVACQNLRTAIVSTMERNIAPDAKQRLLRKDVGEFEKTCGDFDPDARAIFQATLQQLEAQIASAHTAGAQGPADRRSQTANPSAPQRPAFPVIANLMAGAAGDRRGWVALRRGNSTEANFDGYANSATSLPPAGTVLSARWPVPIWAEPQVGPGPDLASGRGLLRTGMCVRVLSARAAGDRVWAEVMPVRCS